MIKYYKKNENNALVELKKAEKNCWINIYPPYDPKEIKELSNALDIPSDFFVDSLDIDERSRYEQEDGVQFIVLNIPVKNEISGEEYQALYLTIPIGIVEVDDYILTISAFKNPVIDYFLERNARNFSTSNHSLFVLLILERTVHYYLHYLKAIDNQRNLYEKELYYSSRNQELSNLMNIQKSLVYFVTSLRGNALMMMRIQRTDFLKIAKNEELADFLDDIIIDMSQAQEMAQIYTDILNTIMNAFASIISNNMNKIMKRLTSITIILMVPTLVASFYGMNVPLMGQEYPFAFAIICIVSVVLTFLLGWFFMRKKLF